MSEPQNAHIPADMVGEATLGRTSSALAEEGDLRAASIVGLCPTLPMSVRLAAASEAHRTSIICRTR